MEYQEPIGLQVIEGLLFEKDPRKIDLLQQVDAISSSAKDLQALLYNFRATDKQLLESVRLELVRIITLGITGFDAPLLKSGIIEAEASLNALQYILHPYLDTNSAQSDSVVKYLSGSLKFLRLHSDFDSFDRLQFLVQEALPLQRHLGLMIKALSMEQNTMAPALNYEAGDIFDIDALDIRYISNRTSSPNTLLISLGKKLFFETGLSSNNKISCATCHNPEKHFTDALPKSIGFDGHSTVKRNAASLLYAGFQYEQFWDGRAKSLEELVISVINNPDEMNGTTEAIVSLLHKNPQYAALLKESFAGTADSLSATDKVAVSIAAFVRSLSPRNSRFDQYMRGADTLMTTNEKKGFNLFMGKAQCATCHFAPLFNGLTPPYYNLSELEVLGTTKTDNLARPQQDSDQGRFDIFPMEFYKGSFKTPTVRNTSATGPYMHNGMFNTLDSVVEFYNKGGANGLGLHVSNQTLSSVPLNLSKKEASDIVRFLHSLEDSITTQPPHVSIKLK
jgi:cytochrome c peroxidase